MDMALFLEGIPPHVVGGKYDVLYYNQKCRTPIPFFGELKTAEYITVGVNPSSTELDKPFWRGHPDPGATADYLNSYFKSGRNYQWFAGWENALAPLKHSFKRNLAHLDLCPRGTKSITAIQKEGNDGLFLEMVEEDMPCFRQILSDIFPRLKGVLLAGTVTRKFYLDEFLINKLDGEFGSEPRRPFPRRPGLGRCEFYHIAYRGKRVPVFFCTSGPSNRMHPGLLGTRISEHLPQLKHLGF
jgi:hypothetical protein